MSRKIDISRSDVEIWESEEWCTYASQSYNGKQLTFAKSLCGMYRVKHGDEILYSGDGLGVAMATWANC